MNRRSLVAASAAVAMLAVSSPVAAAPLSYPLLVEDGFPNPGPPGVTAASWLLYDETSDLVLASFSPQLERAMASTTKIMTGLLVLENSELDEIVTVSRNAANTGEKEIDLVAGEELPMEAMFKALMIHSANDAAVAIAEHISGSLAEFVDLMNRRAEELGLTGTHFANPHGLDAPGHYSTAEDLLALTRVAMAHPEFAQVVRARAVSFPPAPDGTARHGEATNLLLGDYEGNIGVKTGYTDLALLTFVATSEREGRRLYVVVLGSDGTRAHFADARALFDYGFDTLGVYGAVTTGTPYESMEPRVEPSPVVAMGRFEALVHIAALAGAEGASSDDVDGGDQPGPTVLTTHRQPHQAPTSVEGALRHWIDWLLGNG